MVPGGEDRDQTRDLDEQSLGKRKEEERKEEKEKKKHTATPGGTLATTSLLLVTLQTVLLSFSGSVASRKSAVYQNERVRTKPTMHQFLKTR